MNKYMLVLLLAAPGAVYAMEQGDTSAGVGSFGPDTNSQPGGSILAQTGMSRDLLSNRGDNNDSSDAEQAFLAKFGLFEKEIEEVKSDVTTLKSSVDELERAFAALQKGAVSNNNDDAELKGIKERVELVELWNMLIDMEDKDKPRTGSVRQGSNSIATMSQGDRRRLIASTHVLILNYNKKNYYIENNIIINEAITGNIIKSNWDGK